MSYGENFGTNTLAESLMRIGADIYYRLDDGEDYDEIAEDAKNLMEGAMELWERMVDKSE